jgi:hypothetical protein
MTLEELLSKMEQKKPEPSLGMKMGEAGIGAAANLASGLFKAEQQKGQTERELEQKKNLTIAEAQNRAMASNIQGMTSPLSALIANYRASIR